MKPGKDKNQRRRKIVTHLDFSFLNLALACTAACCPLHRPGDNIVLALECSPWIFHSQARFLGWSRGRHCGPCSHSKIKVRSGRCRTWRPSFPRCSLLLVVFCWRNGQGRVQRRVFSFFPLQRTSTTIGGYYSKRSKWWWCCRCFSLVLLLLPLPSDDAADPLLLVVCVVLLHDRFTGPSQENVSFVAS